MHLKKVLLLSMFILLGCFVSLHAEKNNYRRSYKIAKKHRLQADKDIYDEDVFYLSPNTPEDFFFKCGRYQGMLELENILKSKQGLYKIFDAYPMRFVRKNKQASLK